MMFRVIVPKKVKKRLLKIPIDWQKRIFYVLKKLETDPYIGKKLEGEYSDYYSIRVWPYRIIYSIKKKQLIVEIIEIEHRQSAYKK